MTAKTRPALTNALRIEAITLSTSLISHDSCFPVPSRF
jgi:hypothetical protein